MPNSVANGSTVETKAIFVKSVSGGKTFYRRMPFNIEVRTNNSTGKRESYMALCLGGGGNPNRANSWDDPQGEQYDAVEYYDTYPANWPRIGETAG